MPYDCITCGPLPSRTYHDGRDGTPCLSGIASLSASVNARCRPSCQGCGREVLLARGRMGTPMAGTSPTLRTRSGPQMTLPRTSSRCLARSGSTGRSSRDYPFRLD